MAIDEPINAKEVYDRGYIDGLTAYAHWVDGGQEFPTSCTKLSDAIKQRKDTWNYGI